MPNVEVLLLDMNGHPVQYTYTASNGTFRFNNVAYGTYQVYTEILGLPTDPLIVTIAPGNETADSLYIRVNDSGVVSGIRNRPGATATVLSVFPNPINRRAELALQLTTGGEISVITRDALGRMAQQTAPERLAAGQHRLTVDLSTQAPGVYFMEVWKDGRLAGQLRLLKK